jgi:hypothetical protein
MAKEINGVIAEIIDHGKNWTMNFEGKIDGSDETFSLTLDKGSVKTLFIDHGIELHSVEGFSGANGLPVLLFGTRKKLFITATAKGPTLSTKAFEKVPIKIVIRNE